MHLGNLGKKLEEPLRSMPGCYHQWSALRSILAMYFQCLCWLVFANTTLPCYSMLGSSSPLHCSKWSRNKSTTARKTVILKRKTICTRARMNVYMISRAQYNRNKTESFMGVRSWDHWNTRTKYQGWMQCGHKQPLEYWLRVGRMSWPIWLRLFHLVKEKNGDAPPGNNLVQPIRGS